MENNKTNIREQLEKILSDNLEQLETDIQELEPKDRIKILLDVARFVLPTLKSVNTNTQIEQPIFIDFSERIPDISKRNVP